MTSGHTYDTLAFKTLFIHFLLQRVQGVDVLDCDILCSAVSHQCAMRASSQPFSPDPVSSNGRLGCFGHRTKVFSPNPIHA